jgi:hypothetical protein
VLKTTLRSKFRALLDRGFERTDRSFNARLGPQHVGFHFADPDEASAFAASLTPAPEGLTDLDIAVIVGKEPAFAALLPHPRDIDHTYLDDEIYVNWLPAPGELLQVYDFEARRGLMWLPTAQALDVVRSRPALPLFHAHLSRSAWAPTHAAAVGQAGRFLLLAGNSGAGKSTASVACAASGWQYAGDDFVLVHPDDRRVEPIYASARLRPGAAALLDRFVQSTQVAITTYYGDPRNELRLGTAYADVPIIGGQIAAILLPRRSGSESIHFRPAQPNETFLAMVSITLAQLPGFRETLVPKLMRLMREVPAYMVDTGNDPWAIPAAFERFLGELE